MGERWWMKSRLTLIIDLVHPEDYDPVDYFVYYLADDDRPPESRGAMEVSREEWEPKRRWSKESD